MSVDMYFSDIYAVSRLKFRGLLGAVQERWPQGELTAREAGSDEYTTDIVVAPPEEKQNLLLVTTGQHGVEGFAGGAFLQLLVREYLNKLDPKRTGLLLVHAINPWGMANYRRVDQDNVDLNRNFIRDWSGHKDVNKDYSRLRFLLEPGPLQGERWEGVAFYGRVARALAKAGSTGIKRALTLGQYQFDKGLYYGGKTYQPAAVPLIDLYHQVLQEYKRVVHLDIHTGYGPANRMTLVYSPFDPRGITEEKQALAYDLIVKADPEEFYDMQGDMIDYFYGLSKDYPKTELYSVTLEFGTLGDSTGALLQSLRAIVDENRLWQHGDAGTLHAETVKNRFVEAFYPRSHQWRQQVLADSRRALTGILGKHGYLLS